MWNRIRRSALLSVHALLAFTFLSTTVIAAGPPPGGAGGAGATGAAGGGAGAAGAAAASGGAPTSPSGFFSQSSINFSRPSAGWPNWSFDLPVPPGERIRNYYLCYEIEQTSDANVPFLLRNVDRFKSEENIEASKRVPCHSLALKDNARPILRGDRLRVAIDVKGDAAKAFFKDVSVLNLNVVLTVAPPIQVTLLRTNLGSSATTTGLSGNQAPESNNIPSGTVDYQCFFQILGFLPGLNGERTCTGPERVVQDSLGQWRKIADSPKDLLILPWPYTFPGDVIPTIYISALYTTPNNGMAWRPTTLYPVGSLVQCPGENLCTVASVTGNSTSSAIDQEPLWTASNGIVDGPVVGGVVWSPIGTVSYRLKDPLNKSHLPDAPDGKPVYQTGDTVVWMSGQTQVEATIVDWQASTAFTINTVIVCPPDGATMWPLRNERLCVATTAGTTGDVKPQPWTTSGIADHNLTWSIDAQKTDHSHAPQLGDVILWKSSQGMTESIVENWQGQAPYLADHSVVMCPSGLPAPDNFKLCAATQSGASGPNPPRWSPGVVGDGSVKWQYDISSWLQRWKPDTVYKIKDAVRCEQPTQKTNLCVASAGGYSGAIEPWWAAQSAPATPGAASTASAYQRDNQVLWTSAAPTATTASPSADQVVNLSAQELTQVHAPDLWGLSTAVLYTTKKIPNSYSFMQAVPAGCPTITMVPAVPATPTTPEIPPMTVTNYCPATVPSYQRATDIALMISPYVFHHLYSKFHDTADGIDVESKWRATNPEDWIPEPIAGFGLNSIGNSYYVGLSMEIFIRNLQLVGGYGWIKAPTLTNPPTATGSNAVTPNTYMAYKRAPFIGLAFNISGLISGH